MVVDTFYDFVQADDVEATKALSKDSLVKALDAFVSGVASFSTKAGHAKAIGEAVNGKAFDNDAAKANAVLGLYVYAQAVACFGLEVVVTPAGS